MISYSAKLMTYSTPTQLLEGILSDSCVIYLRLGLHRRQCFHV